eukprot:356378-Chlamydomonas_euryale.AAC.2
MAARTSSSAETWLVPRAARRARISTGCTTRRCERGRKARRGEGGWGGRGEGLQELPGWQGLIQDV